MSPLKGKALPHLKVVLVEPKSPDFHVFTRYPMPRLGLPLLATILNQMGHQARVYCEDIAPVEWDVLLDADVVGISSITTTAENAYELADKVRKEGIPVIMGGVHATFLPEEALAHSDYVVRGEGEETLPQLLDVLEGKRDRDTVLGLSFYDEEGKVTHTGDRPLVQDLDALPFPDLTTIHHHERIRLTPIVSSRGCPYDCTFCSVTPMFGRGYRTRSPENVLAELEEKKPKVIFFYDDMFNANRKRMLEILQGIVDRGLELSWTAQVRTNIAKHKGVEDVEALELMRKSGCVFLYVGLESVNPRTLEAFNKAQNVDDIVEAIELVHKYKIMIHGMFVLGSDEDEASTMMQTADFAIKNKIDTVQFMILTPLPGSKDYAKLEEAGRIFNRNWQFYNAHHVVYWPTRLSAWTLQQQVSKATKRFYSIPQMLKLLLAGKGLSFLYRLYGRYIYVQWTRGNKRKMAQLREFVKTTTETITIGSTPSAESRSAESP